LIDTLRGPVQVSGDFGRFSADRPLIFVIRGALASDEQMTPLKELLPDCDVAFADLPGMAGSPFWASNSVEAFAGAMDEATDRFTHTHKVLLGVSTGAVVAFTMARGHAVLALDPPLAPTVCGALIHAYRSRWASLSLETRRWLFEILGVDETATSPRDYRWTLERCAKPGVVLSGQRRPHEPLSASLPGLMTDADIEAVAQHPALRSVVVAGAGHNLPNECPALIVSTAKLLALPDWQQRLS